MASEQKLNQLWWKVINIVATSDRTITLWEKYDGIHIYRLWYIFQETQGWVSIASFILDSVPVWQNKDICCLFIIHVFSSLFLGIGLPISQSISQLVHWQNWNISKTTGEIAIIILFLLNVTNSDPLSIIRSKFLCPILLTKYAKLMTFHC